MDAVIGDHDRAGRDAVQVSGKRFLDFTVYFFLRMLISVIQALRLETCRQIADFLGMFFCDVLRIRQQVVDDNLRQAYPHLGPADRQRLARDMWKHLFLMVVEVAHARRKIHATNWHRHIRLRGGAALARCLLDNRPSILVTGHFGNFEVSGYVLGLFGFPTYTVARPLDNPFLNQFLNRFRGSTGQHILPKNDCADRISQLLRDGATLTLLGDQYAAGWKNCWVDFYGRPASTHKAIALFALTNSAPLAVTYCRRSGGPLQYEVGLVDIADPADPSFDLGTVRDLTQWYTKQLETMINRAPEQYWWLHRRWKGIPPARVLKKWAA